MANYEHLRLVRLPQNFERRKKRANIPRLIRDDVGRQTHSQTVEVQLNQAIQTQRVRRKPQFVDPTLILRVTMVGGMQEVEWERLGLSILASDPDKTFVLFSSSEDLTEFRSKLHAYARSIPAGQRSAAFEGFIGSIESIGSIEPADRIGLRLREAGFTEQNDFLPGISNTIDIELWDFGNRNLRELKLAQLTSFIEENGGSVLDQYIGQSITLMRAMIQGEHIQQLLEIDEVSCIDLPPTPDTFTNEALELTLPEMPTPELIHENAPIIGIVDSGINEHPLISNLIVGAISVPVSFGKTDNFGHGTRVAGVAVYGDLRAQLNSGSLVPNARICSAKVVDHNGKFDPTLLLPTIMRQAITELVSQFGARIINISLGDIKSPYNGGKVGIWATTLDELARDLNIIIVISAGNRCPRGGALAEEGVTGYPQYLLEEENNFLEPGGAVNALTIGAISQHNGLNQSLVEYISNIPIAEPYEPSPFTRVGPGIRGMTKPDLVDFGGTMIYDAFIGTLRSGNDIASAGMLTLNHLFLQQLFRCASGTSYSAPMIANKAAYLLTQLPNASANLIRALLISSAEIPQESESRMRASIDKIGLARIYGNGYVSKEKSAYSDDNRVVLYTEDELSLDYFSVYEIPIPQEYQTVRGTRKLKVTLAYDPPVRHSRADYIGTSMNFRVVRGKDPSFIFNHYRRRTVQEGAAPELPSRYDCNLLPGPAIRDKSTVQTASVSFKRSIEEYGDRYFVIVRCLSGWADFVETQKFAVVVELSHQADVQLYQRIQQRIRPRVQP